MTPTIKNSGFYAIQFRINILLKIFPILFIFIYFINFLPNFNSFIRFRKKYFSFRPYFCLIADIYGIIYFTITFLTLPFYHYFLIIYFTIVLQNEIYHKTINYVVYFILVMIRRPQSPYICQSRNAVFVSLQRSLLQFDDECISNPRRLQYDSTDTALRMEKILNGLKNVCSLVTPLRMRWDWAETAVTARILREPKNVRFALESQPKSPKWSSYESSIKLFNVQLRTCGFGLRKLKFGGGVANCGLKIKLAVLSTAETRLLKYACSVNGNMKQASKVKILCTYTYFFTLMLKYASSVKACLW